MKVVLFTQRVEVIESYNERRDCADQRISDFILKCGYMPIPVPNIPDVATQMVEDLKPTGIILTGGNSLVQYGGNAPERDDTDEVLIKIVIKKSIPLYGFCRGMQSILSYFGNSLENVTGHVAIRHDVSGEINREVNSYHNQACIKLNDDSEMKCIAKTMDGVIEAIRHCKYPIMATMWHPERECPYKIEDVDAVRSLFERRF